MTALRSRDTRGARVYCSRMRIRTRVLALACLLGLAAAPAHADPVVLKFGTLAPPASPWGRVFRVWARATDER